MTKTVGAHWTSEFVLDRKNFALEMLELYDASKHNTGYDLDGSVAAGQSFNYEILAFAAWRLEGDVAEFRRNMSVASAKYLSLYERFEAGEPIDHSFISCIGYQWLFDALAGADMALAHQYAKMLGGRSEIEKREDMEFTQSMAYALKHVVLKSSDILTNDAIKRLELATENKSNLDFRGFPMVYRALVSGDTELLNAGFKALLEGHQRQAKGKGFFRFTLNEPIFLWGIGLANLCSTRGFPVASTSEYLPPELICI
jgi:hypothetical protein